MTPRVVFVGCFVSEMHRPRVWFEIWESHPEEGGDAVEGGDEGFGFGAGVIEGEGGAHGAFDAERFH